MVRNSSCSNTVAAMKNYKGCPFSYFRWWPDHQLKSVRNLPLRCIIVQLGVCWGFTFLLEAFCEGQIMGMRWMGHCSVLNSEFLCLREANHGWGLMRQKERISILGNCLFRVTFSYLSTSLPPEFLSDWILVEQSEMLLFFSGRVESRATQLTADHSKQSHLFQQGLPSFWQGRHQESDKTAE